MKKIVLVESNPLVRAGLRHMLEQLPEPAAVFYMDPASLNGFTYLQQDVDLLILGLIPEPTQAMALVQLALEHLHPRRVLLLSPAGQDSGQHSRAYAQFAYGCLASDAHPETLAAAIHLGLDLDSPRGATQAAPLAHGVAPYAAVPRIPLSEKPLPSAADEAEGLGLTPRQYAMLTRLAKGLPVGSIAHDLGISAATVEAHTATLYQRLGVRNVREAVTMARLRGALLMG